MDRSIHNSKQKQSTKIYLPSLEKQPAVSALARYYDNNDLETVFRTVKAENPPAR